MIEKGLVFLKTGERGFRPYERYRTSGVEWFDVVPEHWTVARLKSFARVRLSNVDKKSEEGEPPVHLCNYVDVYYNDRITSAVSFMEATATPAQIERFSLRRCDVLITKDSESWDDIAIPAVVAEDLENVLCGYHLALIRPDEGSHGPYVARAFEAVGIRDQFRVSANGITRFGLGGDAISSAVFMLPPIEEQLVISAFLDRETARIDALISKKERLIELLQEQRSALITHAVTKGLDANVPMKDSGVEWLGRIPNHWVALSLAYVTTSRCDSPFGSGLKSEHYSSTGVRVIRLQNVGWAEFLGDDEAFVDEAYANQLGDHSVIQRDLLVAGLGDEAHPVGRACVAPSGIEPALVKADCFRFRLDHRRMLPEFAAYQLSATADATAGSFSTGATRSRMNLTATAARKIAVPPVLEQQAIVERVARVNSHYAILIDRIYDAIHALLEMRSSVIYAAVTGKIDVREEVA